MALAKSTVCLLVAVCALNSAAGFIQEMFLYENIDQTGNYFYFQNNVPDATRYPLENVKRVCYRGWWRGFQGVNYDISEIEFRNPYGVNDELICKNGPVTSAKSFRHFAAGNTSENAISVFVGSEKNLYDGREYFVNVSAYAGILSTIQTYAITGDSYWTLFEGTNFNGKSACVGGPRAKDPVLLGFINHHNLTTVGSIFKSCNFPAKLKMH